MRILFALPILLAAGLLLQACESESGGSGGVKVGVADVSRLMRDSVPGKAGIKFLEGRQAEFQKELDDIQDRLEKNPSDEAAMKDLQRVYSASQQQIQTEGQNVAALLFDALQRVIDQYREQNGFTLILSQDTVASFAKSIDVTNDVMRELDKEKIDFKPLPQQAPSAPVEIELPDPASAKDAVPETKQPEAKEDGSKTTEEKASQGKK